MMMMRHSEVRHHPLSLSTTHTVAMTYASAEPLSMAASRWMKSALMELRELFSLKITLYDSACQIGFSMDFIAGHFLLD